MTRIPVDLTAPIACTASGAEVPVRIDQIERMREGLRSIDRTAEGVLLHFEPEPELEVLLARFVVDEKGCCQFWGFEIDESEELTLRWEGPPDAQRVLDELYRYFQSDEPLTAFSGLL